MPETDSHKHREQGPPAAVRALRGIRERGRRRRSGVAVIIQVLLYAALVAVIVAGAIGGPDLYRSIVGGSEHNTLKSNIDRVAQAADEYWGQFAGDRDGRRKIDLVEFCNYANSQFGQGEDITLRTLAVFDGTIAAAATVDASDIVPGVNAGGLASDMAEVAATGTTTANCPVTVAAIDDLAVADIIVGGTGLTDAVATTVDATTGEQEYNGVTHDTIDLEALEGAGLASTRGVWMMQPTGLAAANVPAGAQVGVAANLDLNEVLIIGGVAPDGTSFCLIKIFDADDRADVGEYRVARLSSDGANKEIATCTNGTETNAAGPNTARHNAGWPEAR